MDAMTDPGDRRLIEHSLELTAERAGDLTPLVYDRLFAEQPDAKALFWRDKNDSIKGEMLARAFEALLDFIGERQYADHLIQTSAQVHTEYGVSPDVFRTFFATVAATVRDQIGEQWTPEIAAAWDRVLGEIDVYAARVNSRTAP
jgi:hemoglobin-like flavoprotein